MVKRIEFFYDVDYREVTTITKGIQIPKKVVMKLQNEIKKLVEKALEVLK